MANNNSAINDWEDVPVKKAEAVIDDWEDVADDSAGPGGIQGMFKTYTKKPKGVLQKADVAAANVGKFGLNVLNAPFEAVGEAAAGAIEGRTMKAPTLFGGKNPENPFSVVNKVLRAGAGAVGGIATGNPLESARAAYHAPRGTTGTVEDTAMALLLGKISPSVAAAPIDAVVAAPGVIGREVARGTSKVAKALLPGVVRSTAGIPELATQMALKKPSILSQKPVEESALNEVVGKPIITALQNTKSSVGKSIGKIYKKYTGIDGPMQEIVDTPIAQRINPVISDVPVAQKLVSVDVPAGNVLMGQKASKKFTPGEIITEKKTTGFKPGKLTTVPKEAHSYDDLLINKNLATEAFVKNDQQALSKLYKQYVGTPKSNTNILKIGNKEKLEILTRLKRETQRQAEYNKAPITLQPIDTAKDAAFKRISSDLDKLRGDIPGGKKLEVADKAWSELNGIYDTVQRDLSDPGKSKDLMMRIMRGDSSWLTSGKTKTKVDYIKKVEKLTGQNILEPAMEELTRQVYSQNLGKGFFANLMKNVSLGAVGAGTATLNPLPILAGATTMAMTSPRLIGAGIKGASKMGNIFENTKTGNVLSAVNAKTQGTPLQDVVRKLLQGQPVLAPYLKGIQQ